MIGVLLFGAGCLCALSWASVQADVPEQSELPCSEPDRLPLAPVTLVLVAADDSALSQRIDEATGGLGFSHCFLDVGHRMPDGERVIVDYQPGAGVHYAHASAYGSRGRASIRLRGDVGQQVYGCVRSRIGQPFDAAGLAMGRTTIATCAGLVWGCLPPAIRCSMGAPGRPISPNDYAAHFGVAVGDSIDWEAT